MWEILNKQNVSERLTHLDDIEKEDFQWENQVECDSLLKRVTKIRKDVRKI